MAESTVCPQCGTPRVGQFRFCRSCGLDYDHLPATTPAPPSIPPATPPADIPRPTPGAVVQPTVSSAGQAPTADRPMLVFLALLTLLVVGFFAILNLVKTRRR